MKVQFDMPDGDFTVREAVAVISGWDEKGNPALRIVVRDETPAWIAEALLEIGIRRMKATVDQAWSRM